MGTAGHIDHGKSTLCRRLTGIETDRLREEKERGISIVLGYAFIDTPAGHRIAVVDVPGHERFVKTMVAGATGMDFFMLTVAADEGVMPQTREHVEIAALLGVETGFVVITKCDLVDEELLELVKEDVREFLDSSTPYGDIPVLSTSIGDDESLGSILDTIDRIVERLSPRKRNGPFRMPVDRVFSIRGHGVVAAGTAWSGVAAAGDEVEIMPDGRSARIRMMESFGERRERGGAGERLSLNLAGPGASSARRGCWIYAPPGLYDPSLMADVELELLKDVPGAPRFLEHGCRLKAHSGTAEINTRIYLAEPGEGEAPPRLEQGGRAFAQLRFSEPAMLHRGDRLLLRLASPQVTIGGATVLDPHPPKHRRRRDATAHMEAFSSSRSTLELVHTLLERTPGLTSGVEGIARRLGLPPDEVMEAVDEGCRRGLFIRPEEEVVSSERLERAKSAVLQALSSHHERNPWEAGADVSTLAALLRERSRGGRDPSERLEEEDTALVLRILEKEGAVARKGALYARRGFVPGLKGKARELEQVILRMLESCDATATGRELETAAREAGLSGHLQQVLTYLQDKGSVLRLPGEAWILASRLDDYRRRIVEALERNGGKASTQELKKVLELSRKHLIPILEHLDAEGTTIRSDNERHLRRG